MYSSKSGAQKRRGAFCVHPCGRQQRGDGGLVGEAGVMSLNVRARISRRKLSISTKTFPSIGFIFCVERNGLDREVLLSSGRRNSVGDEEWLEFGLRPSVRTGYALTNDDSRARRGEENGKEGRRE